MAERDILPTEDREGSVGMGLLMTTGHTGDNRPTVQRYSRDRLTPRPPTVDPCHPGCFNTGSSARLRGDRHARLHSLADGPAIVILVEILVFPAERLLDDGINQLDAQWLLGFGTADLTVFTSGANAQQIELANVMGIGHKLDLINTMLQEMEVTKGS